MRRHKFLTLAATAVSLLAIVSNAMALDFGWNGSYGSSSWNGGYRDRDDRRSLEEKIELLRKKVKYVFVIFHENESFDHYFGTFPAQTDCSSAPEASLPPTRRRASRSAISTRR